MKTILFNTRDFILYNLYVRTLNLLGWLITYKVEVISTLLIVGIVLTAGHHFGWNELLELENEFNWKQILE